MAVDEVGRFQAKDVWMIELGGEADFTRKVFERFFRADRARSRDRAKPASTRIFPTF